MRSGRLFIVLNLAAALGLAGPYWEELPEPIPGGALVPFQIIPVPERRLARQQIILEFEPRVGGQYFLEESADGENWSVRGGGPYSTSPIQIEGLAPHHFFRLRQAAEGLPVELFIRQFSTFHTNGFDYRLERHTLVGWNHYLQIRRRCDEEWQVVGEGPETRTIFSLPPAATNHCGLRVLAIPPIEREVFEAFVVSGQSNALFPDHANGPILTNVTYLGAGQAFRQAVGYHSGLVAVFAFSFGSTAAQIVGDSIARPIMLIPTARGGTPMNFWIPSAEDRWTPTNGFAQYIASVRIGAPQGVKAILFMGHESNAAVPQVFQYREDWTRLITELRKELGPVPVIYAQLAKNSFEASNSLQHYASEIQRTMETGQALGLPDHYLVPAFDLPLGDGVHLTPQAQHMLGERFARAILEHIYKQDLDGTGPRLVGIFHPAGDRKEIEIVFTQAINPAINNYDNQFRVFAGPDGDEVELFGFSVRRSENPKAIRITRLEEPTASLSVSYGDKLPGEREFLTNAVRNEVGLPAPRFGKIAVQPIPR